MRIIFGSLSALGLLGLVAAGCGGVDGSEVNGGDGKGASSSTGASSSSGGSLMLAGGTTGVGTSGNGTAIGGSTFIDPSEACATGTASAALSGVNMFVMFDRSSSMTEEANMNGDTRWDLTSAALSAFFASPNAGGLGLALRFFPHDMPAAGCSKQGCDVAACSQPLVDLGTLLADPAPTDAQEKKLLDATVAAAPGMAGAGTPISAALDGALQWAAAQHKKTPDQNTVVVLVTDGQANGCDQDIGNISMLASTALATDGTRTYAIGLTGSQEADMDQIAKAGGTEKGIFVADGADTQQQLLDALGAIRGQILDCDFPMPEPKAGVKVDKDLINVNYTPGSGMKSTLGQVTGEAACTAMGGWFYDDPQTPTRITLCKSTCDAVTADPMAALEILLGCNTVPSVPK